MKANKNIYGLIFNLNTLKQVDAHNISLETKYDNY